MEFPGRAHDAGSGCRHDHLVGFYETEPFLVDTVCSFLTPTLRDGDVAIVVATAVHRQLFEAALGGAGIDVGAAIDDGRYLPFDAEPCSPASWSTVGRTRRASTPPSAPSWPGPVKVAAGSRLRRDGGRPPGRRRRRLGPGARRPVERPGRDPSLRAPVRLPDAGVRGRGQHRRVHPHLRTARDRDPERGLLPARRPL